LANAPEQGADSVGDPAAEPVPYANRGSQRWLQVAVERDPECLNVPLRASLGLAPGAAVEWLSPLRVERFSEYRDAWAFTNPRWHVPLDRRPLRDFWPAGGPMWDGLARTADGRFLLVEAKAHVAELVSPRSRAAEPARGRIAESMREVQAAIAPRSVDWVDWTGTFYQYANRVAHLYLLRELNQQPVDLVNVYFYNAPDVASPPGPAHWEGAIRVVEVYLGLGRHRLAKYMHALFVDAAPLAALAPTRDATGHTARAEEDGPSRGSVTGATDSDERPRDAEAVDYAKVWTIAPSTSNPP
jgi:hypothetical protein